MKIAVVSDTHNNTANFKKAIDWIKKGNIKLILHCGDICSQETIDEAKKIFETPASAKTSAGEIKFVKGNGDHDLDLPDKEELEFNSKKIVFCHFPDIAKKFAQSGKYDLVFYGHTHRPWDELVLSEVEGKKCHMINPGELAGQFYKPTFAIYDTSTGNLELKILENL